MKAASVVHRVSAPAVHRLVRRRLADIVGLENIPTRGPFVLAPNHRSYFDHFVLETVTGFAVGRSVWFLTKRESFEHPLSRLWTTAWRGIPVDREQPGPDTLRAVRRVMDAGDVLCVYPEGTRNTGHELLPFHPGAFRFALASGVPVIPVAMAGTDAVLPPGARRFSRGRARIAFGEPIVPDLSRGRADAAARLSSEAKAAIVSMYADLAAMDDVGVAARDHERRGSRAARAFDRLTSSSLAPDATLPREASRRLRALLALLSRAHPRSHDLLAQRARLQGLTIAHRPLVTRILPSLVMRHRLKRVMRVDPAHAVANYLMGRWHQAMPSILGGDAMRAEQAFRSSAESAEAGDTRALAALADLQVAEGRFDEAREMLCRVADAPTRGEPRAELRAERARHRLAELSVRTAEPEGEDTPQQVTDWRSQ